MSATPFSDPQEAHLTRVARAFPYPPTPDLAGRVLIQTRRSVPRAAGRQRRLVWAALAGAVAFFAAIALVPEVQAAVRQFFRIGGITVVGPPPTATARPGAPSPTPSPIPTYALLPTLSGETTLAAAQQAVVYPLLVPAYPPGLGPPDRVFVQDLGNKAVILVWTVAGQPERARLALYEIPAGFAGTKELPPGSTVQETTVGDDSALWLDGPHMLRFAGGHPEWLAGRLVPGHTLIWEHSWLTYRLETDQSLDEARRMAESLRPLPPASPP